MQSGILAARSLEEVAVECLPVGLPLCRAEQSVFRMAPVARCEPAQGRRHNPGILVEQIHIVVGMVEGIAEPPVVGPSESLIPGVLHHDGLGEMLPDEGLSAVGRPIVDDIDIGLYLRIAKALQALLHPAHAIVGHDDGEYSHASSVLMLFLQVGPFPFHHGGNGIGGGRRGVRGPGTGCPAAMVFAG